MAEGDVIFCAEGAYADMQRYVVHLFLYATETRSFFSFFSFS